MAGNAKQTSMHLKQMSLLLSKFAQLTSHFCKQHKFQHPTLSPRVCKLKVNVCYGINYLRIGIKLADAKRKGKHRKKKKNDNCGEKIV